MHKIITQGFKSRPCGLKSRPQGFKPKPQGLKSRPQGFKPKPQGLKPRPQGLKSRPQGFKSRPQGLKSRPQGFKSRPQGLKPRPQGLKTTTCSNIAITYSDYESNNNTNGNATQNTYDKGGRLTRTTDARGYYTDYEYNKDGLRTKLTYYKDETPIDTNYTYYANHLLESTTYPGFSGSNTTTNVYDANGNLTSKTDAKSQTISYAYDNNNRLTTKTYPDYSTVVYTYDASSNILTVDDANTNTDNEYDDLNRLNKVTDNISSKVIEYGYYEDGTRSAMTATDSSTITYTYDNAKRLKTVSKGGTTEATYDYNTLGLRTKLTLGNSSYTDYEYDSVTRWLDIVTNTTSTGTVISSFAYQHDNVGNRTQMTLDSGDVISYTYDVIYQLTNEVRTGAISYTNYWTFDNVGNRLSQIRDSITTTNYAYNNANQLISDTALGLTNIYQYDNNGNMTQKADGTNTWLWGYDYDNRQVSYDAPGTSTDTTYVYNAGGARISKTVNGVTEKYILDGANVIADYDGSDNLVASYVTPFLDQNLLMTRDSNTYYYMQDGLGSVRNLVSSVESVVNSYDYYAFGENLSTNELVSNRYRFTAREWDGESQTNYFRYRQQDPYTGRFLSADLMGYDAGINLYSYVRNNPVNSIDPNGFCGCPYTYVTNNPVVFASIFGDLWERIFGKKEPEQEKMKPMLPDEGNFIKTITGKRILVRSDCSNGEWKYTNATTGACPPGSKTTGTNVDQYGYRIWCCSPEGAISSQPQVPPTPSPTQPSAPLTPSRTLTDMEICNQFLDGETSDKTAALHCCHLLEKILSAHAAATNCYQTCVGFGVSKENLDKLRQDIRKWIK